ncbi:E3 ubiquitin-protein ligase rad18, partial [Mortierella sp. GBA30]
PVLRSRVTRSQPPPIMPRESVPTSAPQPSQSPQQGLSQPQESQPTPLAAHSAPTTPTKAAPPSVPLKHSLVPCPICQMGIPEAYSNIHLDKYCLTGKKDPAYTIPHHVIIKQNASLIALYERQGTSTQNVMSVTPAPSSPQRNTNSPSNMTSNGQFQNGFVVQSRPSQPVFNTNNKRTYSEQTRIPKLTYSLLNDKQLRKKLQELELPTHGDKQLMQKRHAEYVTIFNANCDATRPQPVAQLKKAMEAWERAYELDMAAKEEAKEAQRRVQEQEQRRKRQEMAQRAEEAALIFAASSKPSSMDPSLNNHNNSSTGIISNTPPTVGSSQPSSQSESSTITFVPNQANNNDVAVAVASATAFAHAAKYADEYAELIADVKRRIEEDKAKKASADKKTTELKESLS